ncbi:MAG: glycoside hydrolase family 32 protein [Acidobacteriaceae bacterium]
MRTRRQFLKGASAAYCAVAFSDLEVRESIGESQPELASQLAHDPRRPQFHLLPTHNWMNDPNGPVYFAGLYHMFFQYNPEAPIWGNMSWNHAVSPDMLHWRNYPVAFTMTTGSADAAGCFSGSMLVEEHAGKPRAYAIYTGVTRDKAKETIRNEGLRESQCLAWSDDLLLQQWQKSAQPAIPNPPAGLAITGFRDPFMWKEKQAYLMTVGSGVEKRGGCVLLYRSTNLMDWEYLHPLASGSWNGTPTPNPVDDGEMWECPDFFPLDGGHVLIYSTMGKVFWQSGLFDQETLRFKANKSGELDVGAFYAPKTQLDAEGRRILWGWIPERRSQAEMLKAGWSGMMSLPRLLHLESDGTLRMQILPQTEVLRGGSIVARSVASGSVLTLPAATGEVWCAGKRDSASELSFSLGSTELMTIRYEPVEGAWLVDEKKVVPGPSDRPSVHAFVDGSVIEVILSERAGYVRRFYYPGAVAPDLTVRVKGTGQELRGWEISPITQNRLTTIGPFFAPEKGAVRS